MPKNVHYQTLENVKTLSRRSYFLFWDKPFTHKGILNFPFSLWAYAHPAKTTNTSVTQDYINDSMLDYTALYRIG